MKTEMTHVEHDMHTVGSDVFVVTCRAEMTVRKMTVLGWLIDHSSMNPDSDDQLWYKFPGGLEMRAENVFATPEDAFSSMDEERTQA